MTKKIEEKKVTKKAKEVTEVSMEQIDADHVKYTYSDGTERILFV